MWPCCALGAHSDRPPLRSRVHAALPFICLNVLAGGLVLYGLAGLRYEGWAVAQFAGLLLLQSLVAIQVAMFAVYLTPNQARACAPAGRGAGTVSPPAHALLAHAQEACHGARQASRLGSRVSRMSQGMRAHQLWPCSAASCLRHIWQRAWRGPASGHAAGRRLRARCRAAAQPVSAAGRCLAACAQPSLTICAPPCLTACVQPYLTTGTLA